MSALSALGGSSRSNVIPGAGDSNSKDRSTGTDFASMMSDKSSVPAPKPKQKTAQEPQDKSASRPDKSEAQPASNSQDNPSDNAGATGQTRNAEASERKRATGDTAETAAKPSDTKTAEQQDDHDDAWPPSGLAGFGMAVLPVLNTVLPGAIAAPLQAAGLVMTAAKGIAGLLGGDADATGASASPAAAVAATATAPATGASAAVANGGFTGLLAQTAAMTKAASTEAAPMAALAALVGAGGQKHDDALTTAGADPISLLASVAPAPASRMIDSSVPFNGSPTPTPDLNSDNFDDALGVRMNWLADQKIGHAHIKISPADLGPIEVRLHLNGDQVNASFTSAQADVRHALESSLPRLRDMLSQHGFQLGQADVGQQQQQASQGGQQSSGGHSGNPANDDLQGTVGIPAVVLRQRGLVDAYA